MEETKVDATVEVKLEPPKKTKKEIEEEKRQKEEEIRLAAEEAAMEKERRGLIQKLEKMAEREAHRLQQKWQREITDKVKVFSVPEQQARLRIQTEYARALQDVKAEFEQALKELMVERDRAYQETTKVRDGALETLREKNKEKYDALESELERRVRYGADRFEGFKNRLDSATLDDLKALAKKSKAGDLINDVARTAEAGA